MFVFVFVDAIDSMKFFDSMRFLRCKETRAPPKLNHKSTYGFYLFFFLTRVVFSHDLTLIVSSSTSYLLASMIVEVVQYVDYIYM